MPAADDILKHWNAYMNGVSLLGKVNDFTPPNIVVKTEEFKANGMDAPLDIDTGLEKLTAEMVFPGYVEDVMALWGLANNAAVNLTIRGSLESRNGNKRPIVIVIRGMITGINRGGFGTSGKAGDTTVALSLDYYREQVDGRLIYELEPAALIRIVDGVDQLATTRANMGL